MNPHLMFARRTALALVLLAVTIFSIAAQQKQECSVKVTLLQVNDVYQFAPVDQGTKGGLGRVMTLKKAIQQENPNTLFLMAGDTISPSVESITYKGSQMIDAWNAVGIDYSVFGNHEFDIKLAELMARITQDVFKHLYDNGLFRLETEDQTYCEDDKLFLADRFVEGVCPQCGYDVSCRYPILGPS